MATRQRRTLRTSHLGAIALALSGAPGDEERDLLERLYAIIERTPIRTWSAIGVVGLVGPLMLAALPSTPFAADLALLTLALLAPLGSWTAVRIRTHLDELPLEIAPVAATGTLDGVRIYRFRVRLGRNRIAELPSATVSFEDDDGDRFALRAEIPTDHLVGPFTIVSSDPDHVCAGPGSFLVDVECESGGLRFVARARIDKDSVREGWFAGGIATGASGRLEFTPQWTAVVGVPAVPQPLRSSQSS